MCFSSVQPEYANPPPGTIVDHTVTRFKYKDFFLVPQSVNQGTVTPTHFIVLKENPTAEGLDATAIQKLAYKLTHMYYNWPGTVRGKNGIVSTISEASYQLLFFHI